VTDLSPWRVSYGLTRLLHQINEKAPNRNKASDGSIGDAAHQATTSDHNPDSKGIVRAMDFTNDPAHGADMGVITEAIRQSHDPRVAYMIFNHRIVSSTILPWTWRSYSGTDPHTGHMHISTVSDDPIADGIQPWSITLGTSTGPSAPTERAMTMQSFLRWTGSNAVILTDGRIGVWIKSESDMADILTLWREGTFSLGNEGNVRVVGNRDLCGQLIGDRPAEWPAISNPSPIDDTVMQQIADILITRADNLLAELDRPMIIDAVQEAIRNLVAS
jgi:hypothetical protein